MQLDHSDFLFFFPSFFHFVFPSIILHRVESTNWREKEENI